jgi:glyoxylase-like metal-dependent hydrolase (beta-lactamase superfamily II)
MAEWSGFYDARVAATEGATITQIARTARGCLSYLVDNDGVGAVVDPGRHVDVYLDAAAARRVRIEAVIDTHAHADHVSGGPALARRCGAPYYLHPYDAIHPVDMLPARLDYEPLCDGRRVTVGGTPIEPLWIPGHTLGNMALHVAGRYLLCGDSIFVHSVARPDLGGRPEAWTPLHYDSLRRLLALPDSTVVLPGHFSRRDEADSRGVFGATLGQLRDANDGLRQAAGSREAFTTYINASLPTFPREYLDIKRINANLLDANEEQLAELETGKNQCALGRPS